MLDIKKLLTKILTGLLGKVNKSGDTMSGELYIKREPASAFKIVDETVDMKEADNNLSANRWSGLAVMDKNRYTTSGFYSAPRQSGHIATGIWAYNRNAAGQQIGANLFAVNVNKNGSPGYEIGNVDAFRSTLNFSNSVSSASVNSSNSVSLPSATYRNIASRTVAAGVWLIICWIQYPANANGIRFTSINTSQAGSSFSVYHGASPAGVTRQQVMAFFSPTAQTTYYLVAYQSSGTTMTIDNAWIQAFRLA